jgi:hypothetical protein
MAQIAMDVPPPPDPSSFVLAMAISPVLSALEAYHGFDRLAVTSWAGCRLAFNCSSAGKSTKGCGRGGLLVQSNQKGGGFLRRPQAGHVRVLEAVPLSEAISLIGPILWAVVGDLTMIVRRRRIEMGSVTRIMSAEARFDLGDFVELLGG